MLLHARPITKAALHAMTAAAPSAPRPQAPARPAVVTKPPQILQSGHAPAQLSFTFTRW